MLLTVSIARVCSQVLELQSDIEEDDDDIIARGAEFGSGLGEESTLIKHRPRTTSVGTARLII